MDAQVKPSSPTRTASSAPREACEGEAKRRDGMQRLKEIKVNLWDLEGKDGDEMEKPEVDREPETIMEG